METKKVCIGKARIKGINKNFYYLNPKCFYAWDIMFIETSTTWFHNLPFIYLADEGEEEMAEKELNRIKYNFKSIGISEASEVAVLFEKSSGQVLAIAPLGSELWIDVVHGFDVKTFRGLHLYITELRVF